MLTRAERSAQETLLRARSLSLTIWGAKLHDRNQSGRAWDLRSPPDALARVYLAGRLIRQSGVQRDTLQPFWALTAGPLEESRFFEGPVVIQVVDQDVLGEEVIEEVSLTLPTQEQIGRIQQAKGDSLQTLIYQWIAISPQESQTQQGSFAPDRSARVIEREPPLFTLPTRPLDRSTRQDFSESSGRSDQSARRVSIAAQLYRSYLRAQFEGDRLRERALLLRLAQRYPKTRHGHKARRILLLE